MFVMQFDTDNDEFDPTPFEGIARLLRECADRIERINSDHIEEPDQHWIVRDINGNAIGICKLHHNTKEEQYG